MEHTLRRILSKTILLCLPLLLSAPSICFASGFTLGYGLVFSVNELRAGDIDGSFSDIAPGGHSSWFYIEKHIDDRFSLAMSPGAMNFESGDSQFHVQYNILSANFRLRGKLYPVVGAGLGGCIATLTEGSGERGEPQSGSFVRNSAFLWMYRAGLGYRISDRWEATAEARSIGFFDARFKRLTSYNAGFSVGYKI